MLNETKFFYVLRAVARGFGIWVFGCDISIFFFPVALRFLAQICIDIEIDQMV